MGTRHHQTVIDKDGNMKLSQYGQWDGYPSGQGIDILNYLRNGNLEKYQEELAKLRHPTKEESKSIEKDKNWPKNYPYLSRDCGAKIHQMIEDGEVKFVQFISDSDAKWWCEGFYTINFQTNTFESIFHDEKSVWPLDSLPTDEEYIKSMSLHVEEDEEE